MPSSDHSAAQAPYDLRRTVWPEDEEERSSTESVPSGFLPPSEVLGRYVVLYRLGTGGMGVVYAAYDPELDRKVALKLLRRFSTNAGRRERAQKRLLEEARAMARLSHPNVITVHDVALVNGRVVVAMEFVDGQTLSAALMKGETNWRKTVEIMVQAGRGLAAAHEAGIVHRDFKPDNVMLAKDGRVLVMDFGLARALDVELSSGGTRSRVSSIDEDQRSSRPSRVRKLPEADGDKIKSRIVGTPAYMAPEQHRGRTVDGRTDQFSFCVTLYESLYGHRPFQGDTPKEMLAQIETGQLPDPPSHTKVPSWVRAVVAKGLSVDPAERYPSMEHLLRVLEDDPAVRRKRTLSLGAAVLGVSLAGTGAWALHSAPGSQCENASQRLEGVWDPDRQGEIEAAFLASGRPYAESSWQAVKGALDGYTQQWVEMHRDVCEATHVRGEQSDELMDLRMECLGRRRSELAALSDVFTDVDAALVESGVSATGKLIPISVCADAELLKAPVPPPDDPRLRVRIEEVRDQLADAKAHEDAGRLVRGAALARAALEQARQVGYDPLLAEAYVRVGRLEMLTGSAESAEESLRHAIRAAARGHHDEVAARAWVTLAQVLGYGRGDVARGEEVLQAAEAAVDRAGRPADLEAVLYNATGVALMQRNELQEAEAALENALHAQRRAVGEGHISVAGHLNNLAAVQLMQGRFEQGSKTLQEAIETEERMLGPSHPRVGVMTLNVASVALQEGNPGRARPILDRGKRILETSELIDHPDYARALHLDGWIHQLEGDLDAAATALEQSVAIGRSKMPNHPDLARSLARLAGIENRRGNHARAAELAAEALEMGAKGLGEQHPDLASFEVELAVARLELGETEAARTLLEKAVPVLESRLVLPEDTARGQLALARALIQTDASRAEKMGQRARSTYATLPPEHVLRGRADDVQRWLDQQHGTPQ